jgi:hypothetical protein
MFVKTAIESAAAMSVAGMLALGAIEPAFAAPVAKERKCTGPYQVLQNGKCVVKNTYVNPGPFPNPCAGGVCYRSGAVKHKRSKTRES